ncbi:MAG: TAXI family TRAP transporter solute-binding subunit [Pseudomonadota bacterium]
MRTAPPQGPEPLRHPKGPFQAPLSRDEPESDLLIFVLVAMAVALVAFWYASRFIEPAPPRTITMSTGSKTGAYYRYGKLFAKELAREGITVKVVTSNGSTENIQRLMLEGDGDGVEVDAANTPDVADVAFVQGGLETDALRAKVYSLGRLYLEPVWVFTRGTRSYDQLGDLKGKRIAIGAKGSGTRPLALDVLKRSGITEENSTLLSYGSNDAREALIAEAIDAVFVVSGSGGRAVQGFLHDPNLRPLSFSRAAALSRIYPYLTRIEMPRGVIDLVKDIPNRDVELVAPATALLVRRDLHPALVDLLTKAALKIHSEPGLFWDKGAFPRKIDTEYTLSPDAQRYYASGEKFLARYLPFWLATFIERSIVMLIPILTVMLPLIRFAPMAYEWRMRRRILGWYGRMKRLESRAQRQTAGSDVTAYIDELEALEAEVNAHRMPLYYTDQIYQLREHIEMVRRRFQELRAGPAAVDVGAA